MYLMMAGGDLVTLSAYGATGSNASGGACGAGVRVKRDGNISVTSSNNSQILSYSSNVGGSPNEWANPPRSDVGDAYHVRMVTSSGSLTAGTADSWLALTSDRTFEVTRSGVGTSAWTGTMQISRDGGATVLAQSSSFTIQAISEI